MRTIRLRLTTLVALVTALVLGTAMAPADAATGGVSDPHGDGGRSYGDTFDLYSLHVRYGDRRTRITITGTAYWAHVAIHRPGRSRNIVARYAGDPGDATFTNGPCRGRYFNATDEVNHGVETISWSFPDSCLGSPRPRRVMAQATIGGYGSAVLDRSAWTPWIARG